MHQQARAQALWFEGLRPARSRRHARRIAATMRSPAATARPHGPARPLRVQHRRAAPARQHVASPPRAIDIDFSDSDTWVGIAAVVLGLGLGIGAPIFYTQRIDEDEKSLEELRKRNRENFKETGEYLSEDEIKQIRTPRWTDRREFVDDD